MVLNQDKVRTMTKLAIYEKNEGREELKINKYYKSDYIRLQVIKSFVGCTLGFLLVVGFIALYNMEYLVINLIKLDFAMIGKYLILIYVIVSIFYIFVAIARATIEVNKTKKGLYKYNSLLNDLRKIYDKDEATKE